MVGIDFATNPRDVGIAIGVLGGDSPRIDQVVAGTTWAAIEEQVVSWITSNTLIALDAPLGWPRALGEALLDHRAGATLPSEANAMFRRSTDDVVAEQVGKRSLDVGADRIARTAHAALSLLGRLRARTELEIPMAWTPGTIEGVAAIEVYPAGTLAGRGLPHTGYKGTKDEAVTARRRLLEAMGSEVALRTGTIDAAASSDHVLDAVLCVLAGFDFARGRVIAPSDRGLAEREGWIWVRPPSRRSAPVHESSSFGPRL